MMRLNCFRHTMVLLIAAAAAIATTAYADSVAHGCRVPADLVRLVHPLKRLAQHIAAGQAVKIVAIGSSSTAGAGASSPAKTYPSQLAVELKALLPNIPITVVNRGVNGEESRDMLARFDRDVFAEHPDVVLWQVGSNSVLRDHPIDQADRPLHEGLRRLREANVDVVLINPQYAPKVFTKHDVDSMIHLIDFTAKQTNIDLFQRFAVMKYWHLTEGMPFSEFLSPDELHMNDWSYGCLGKLLAGSLYDAATRATVTATAGSKR